jgi:ABC-type uncharacterized transport system substrate-binding protein
MKTCNVYIISLDDELQHRMIVSETLAAVHALVRDKGEAYFPRMFFIDDAKEETLLNVINVSKYGRPDIIVSVGVSIALGLAELYKRIVPISTIFTGVYDPVAYKLVNSLEVPGGCMSGVRWEIPESYDFLREKLAPLAPAIKKIFMPYDTRLDQLNFSIKDMVTQIANQFRLLGCEVILQGVSSKKEAIDAVKEHLATVHSVAGFGLAYDTEQEVSYACGMTDRIFISNQEELGIDTGATASFRSTDPSILYTSIAKMIQNYWWNRQNLGVQSVVTITSVPVKLVINRFMLPYWAIDLVYALLIASSEIVCENRWIGSPIGSVPKKK